MPTSPAVCLPGRAIRRSPPCETGKRAHGHPRTTPGVSLDRPAPSLAVWPHGRTGRDENRGCCSGSRRCSCSGWPIGGFPVRYSRNPRAPHAGRLAARSPAIDGSGNDPGGQTLGVGVQGVANPALHRRFDVVERKENPCRGSGEPAHPAPETVAIVATRVTAAGKHRQPSRFGPSTVGPMGPCIHRANGRVEQAKRFHRLTRIPSR